jgi:acyl carrier protein
MRVLDEMADAFHRIRVRGGCGRREVISSDRLEDQFGSPVAPEHWASLERRLDCLLPPLEFDQGPGWLPRGLITVWDLAAYISAHGPFWAAPRELTTSAWREAQIFAGVREVLVEAGNLDPEQITRPARLVADLDLS